MTGNVYAELAARFATAPGQRGLTDPGGGALTFAEVDDRAARMAAVLQDHRVAPGDRVVAQVAKSLDNIALYLACLRHGAIYVPLNTAYTASEVDYFVTDADPALFVAEPEAPVAVLTDRPRLTLGPDGDGSLAIAADEAGPATSVANRGPDDPAVLIYTSGTTGPSKGAMLTHRNLITNALALHEIWAFEAGDVLLHVLPLFHVHGLMVALHTALLNRSEIVLLRRFDVDAVIEHLPKATVMMAVPTHYSRLLTDARFDRTLTAHVRLFTSGSAPMTEGLHARFTERTGHHILERYGMSEAGMITSNPYLGERVPGTVGFPLPDVGVRIRDADGNQTAGGDIGEVEVRGPNVFAGYWRQPEQTANAMTPDGWLRTGDIGRLDADGRLTIEGRLTDVIISGGYNIYPREIERALLTGAGIEEAAVVGIPHPDLGEAVTAFVVPTADAELPVEEQTTALSGLARFKHPKRFVPVDVLPRNTMGKVQKTVLRERHLDLYE